MESQFEFTQYLLAKNLLTNDELQACLSLQHSGEQGLLEILQGGEFLNRMQFLEAIGDFWGLPYAEFIVDEIDLRFLQMIPGKWLLQYHILPYKLQNQQLFIATADKLGSELMDDLNSITGLEIVLALADLEKIEETLWTLLLKIHTDENAAELNKRQVYEIDEVDFVDENIAKTIVNSLLQKAIMQRASDIHLELYAEQFLIKWRIDGFLQPVWRLPKQLHSQIINRLKIMAELDITEKRIAQDGHISIRWQQQEFDLRVSTLPLIYGEKMLLRLLGGKQNLGRLADLDFSDENRLMLEQAIKLPYGLILATGPTGSGKTTTLYSLLNALKGHGKNIVTIEDPVEYEISGVNQLQVNEKTGMTFAAGLRGILRQDPDIIMVGEIRDPETAEIAIKAASTGHLVLGSLHTNDAMSAVSRLIDLGIAPFLVASCVLAVIGQRLVRKNCQHCLMDYQYPLPKSEGVVSTIEARRGTGCGFCNNLGYLGRIALQEVWLLTAEDREWISQGASLVIVRKQARERGFKTIKMDGLEKVRLGLTTVEEVMLAAMTE